MPKFPHALFAAIAFAGLSFPTPAQTTGPQLTVSPGLIYTIASRATSSLGFSAFNGVAFKAPGTLYVSDAHSEARSQNSSISLANIYAVDLTTGQVTRVAGILPDHINGNIADCTAVGAPAQASCPGDGGLAANAQFHEPAGLALDAAGNLFIADLRQQVIRRVDAATGIITTIAGTGVSGVGCNSCAAAQANLSFPNGLAFDRAGNLYVADTANNRVRVITSPSSNGVMTTIAGTTASGFGGDNGPATSALLNEPIGVTVDNSGNIFIADTNNHAVRKITAANGLISTVAGQGRTPGYTGDGGAATSATLRLPRSVAVDAGGNLYIADTNNSALRKVNGDVTQTISTIAGNGTTGYSGDGGSAITASLNGPAALAIDGQSNLYFSDNQFGAIRKVASIAAPITLPAGSSSSAPLVVSNTGDQAFNLSSYAFSNNNFVAGTGTCYNGILLNPGASCTLPVSFNASGGGTSSTLTLTSNTGAATNIALAESTGLYFVPVTPCRVIETRLPNSGGSSAPNNFVGPAFAKGEIRSFAIRNSNVRGGCASGFISSSANVQAYSFNITVVPKGALAYVTVYPGGGPGVPSPTTSTLNSYDGRIKANAAIVPANSSDGTISIYADAPTDIVVDINGYYVSQGSPASSNNGQAPLAFYPLPPCRAVDTRLNSGLPTSGYPLLGGTEAPYVLAGTCNLPLGAGAYALNYTVLPKNSQPLFYLTTWPTGTPRPNTSTLNDLTGTVTANAAIVPASANGSVSVYSTDDTDLIIDVAGYYAPPSANGLSLYPVTPCRAYDTRLAANDPHATIHDINNLDVRGPCGVPPAAQSFVLNTTAIPPANQAVRYLSAWPQGTGLPVQSVLNAYDGQVTSNLAVVPTVNGLVSTYLSEPAGLILDLYAYFAP